MISVMKTAINKTRSNNVDLGLLNVTFKTEINANGWLGKHDPTELVQTHKITIEFFDEELSNIRIPVGEGECYYLDEYDWVTDSLNNLIYVADSVSGDFLNVINQVTDNNGILLEDYIGTGILYVKKFYIRPEFRSKGIGQIVFPLILNTLERGAAVTIITPCPTEDNGIDTLDPADPDYKSKLSLMCEFIQHYGFVQSKLDDSVWLKDNSLKAEHQIFFDSL